MTHKINSITIKIPFFLLLLLLVPLQVQAHNLWLNATDFSPTLTGRAGAHSKVYFGFGHKFPVADFLDKSKLREFQLIRPDLSKMDLEAGNGGFLATPLVLKKSGAYTVSAATNTGFYTMYNKNGRMHHKLGSMEGLENIVLSLYFENYTKALINVGETADQDFSTPVGHNIEIVPLENPYLKRVGDLLKLQVLQNGKPVPFCQVSATYVGFSAQEDYAYSSKTNSKGIATIRLLNQGQWIIMAVVREQAPENLKDQCLEMKYSASLSFGVN
ncbi:DUF4198 domain-containing protein [uncultured Desulfuromusa sp.]|uniref:DUF4198 domain-containing protein n=1 Tax=uncultured Desulfuromusa sp. TaxID=219183 RepID=UPI002AA6CC89|nr:DUF4198 domain-containing protein [uncultured Desulfuromusa sp.]